MPSSTITDQVKAMLETAFESKSWGNSLMTAMSVDPRLLTDVAPMDDGVPPADPQNIRTTAFLKSVSVQWDQPRKDDFVAKVVVEATPQDGVAFTEEVVQGNGIVFGDLEYVDHVFRVKFVDIWDRESNWSAPSTARPAETADYKFDMARMRELGNITGMLEMVNTELLAGDNFAEATVRQIALAQPEYPNQLPLIEVDFDQWDAGTIWPPTDTDKDGNQYIHAQAPPGIDASVVEINGKKWLKIIRGEQTTPDPSYYPFSAFKRRQTEAGVSYIASVFVQGIPGTQARFGVQASSDDIGSGLFELANTDAVTLTDEPKRLSVKFTMGETFPYIRFRLDTVGDTDTTYWTNFQLERADNKTEPSVWTPGVMSTGVVNARMLTAIDAVIADAIFKEASIASAAIKDLTADKITAGILDAGQIRVASTLELIQGQINPVTGQQDIPPGRLVAGYTWLDSSGLSLPMQGNYVSAPTTISAAIMGRNDDGTLADSAIAFYDDTASKYRGIVLRADGDLNNDGLIAIHATNDGNLLAGNTAKIEVRSGGTAKANGVVTIGRSLVVLENALANEFRIQGGQHDGMTLTGHGHAWSEINNKPPKLVNDGDNVDKLNIKNLQLNGKPVNTAANGYLKVNAN